MHPWMIVVFLVIYLRENCCRVVSIPGKVCCKSVYHCVKKIVLETSLDLIKANLDFIERRKRRSIKGRERVGATLPHLLPANWFLVT